MVFWKPRKEWSALTNAPERPSSVRTERWAHFWGDFCFTFLFNAPHFLLLFHGSWSGEEKLSPWWGHFCLSGTGGPSPAESRREDLLYQKGKRKIPAHFRVHYLILPTTSPGRGVFVGLFPVFDGEGEVQRENLANFRSWALKSVLAYRTFWATSGCWAFEMRLVQLSWRFKCT